jgi:hypothetical protein
MKCFLLLFFILFISNICQSQKKPCNFDYIFCNAIDSVLQQVQNQGPNVYHDWTGVSEFKDSSFYHFRTRSYKYYLNAVVDTGNTYMRLGNYSAKRIFECFLGNQIIDSKSKGIFASRFSNSIPCAHQSFLKSEFLFDSATRFRMDSNYYETVLIKSSEFYIYKKFGFQYLSLFRGKWDHGVYFYFFYKKEKGIWKLQSLQNQNVINEWMQK